MATEAGPGKLGAGGQALKELESGMAAWEQGRARSAHSQLLSRASCCVEKGWSVARAPCGHPPHPFRAPHLLSGAPLAPQPLLTHCILLPSITLPLPWLPALPLAPRHNVVPYPGDPTFPTVSGALPAQGFSWDVEEEDEEGSRDSVCLLAPVCAAHQPARRPGVGKEEEANPKLPWMVQEEVTQNLNP